MGNGQLAKPERQLAEECKGHWVVRKDLRKKLAMGPAFCGSKL